MQEKLFMYDTLCNELVEVGSLDEARKYVKEVYTEGKSMHPDFGNFDVYKKVGEVYVEEDSEGTAIGIRAAPRLPESAEWVRVEDGLPEESGYILAYDKNNVFPTQMRWYDVGFELKQVCTHWRPLPAPPKPNNE